jgi:hypothetical protein
VKANLNCEACERELVAYVDGALHRAVARVLEQHLDACARCTASLEFHRAIAGRLATLPGIPVPAGLEERVVRAVAGPRRAAVAWKRVGAGALALSFAATIGGLAFWPRLAALWGLPNPTDALARGIDAGLKGLIAVPKQFAGDVAFYEPIVRQICRSVDAFGAVPNAVLLSLRSPEAQAAGFMWLTLGVALYLLLRPSARKEGGIVHACLAL